MPFSPPQLLQPSLECRYAMLGHQVALCVAPEHADAPHALARLRACPNRPRRSRAAEQHDELAAPDHSITSSAVASSVGGTASPSILAVSALITSSNLLACITGKSAGFAPLRMRPA